MTADPMQRAREFLAAEYEASTDAPEGSGIRFHAANVRVIGQRDYADWKDRAALRVIAALLTREEEIRGAYELALRNIEASITQMLREWEGSQRGDAFSLALSVVQRERTAIRSAPPKDET